METTAYSKRGWLFSPGFSWSNKAEENILFGNLDSGWINDQEKTLARIKTVKHFKIVGHTFELTIMRNIRKIFGLPVNSSMTGIRRFTEIFKEIYSTKINGMILMEKFLTSKKTGPFLQWQDGRQMNIIPLWSNFPPFDLTCILPLGLILIYTIRLRLNFHLFAARTISVI